MEILAQINWPEAAMNIASSAAIGLIVYFACKNA